MHDLETSDAILAAFAERGIRYIKDRLVTVLDPARNVAVLDNGSEMPYALFLEIGTSKMAARPFFRPAFFTEADAIARIISTGTK